MCVDAQTALEQIEYRPVFRTSQEFHRLALTVKKGFIMTTNRVLCVEDDADTRLLLKTMLGFSGFEAAVAQGADDALRLMKREQFSLYVLDGGLPGISGLSLCERIRAADAHTPIVIFSGHAFASDIKAGMSAGANAYIVKPELSKLVPTIRNLLEAVTA